MKKILAMMLALTMVLSFAACGQNNNSNGNNETTEGTTLPEATLPGAITYFSLSYSKDGATYAMSAYEEGGELMIDYMGQIIKRGSIEVSAMEQIANAFAASGLVELNGAEEYTDGMDYASIYVTLEDDTMISANYSGKLPQAFLNGYAKMDTAFQALITSVPEYVAEPFVMGEVNAEALAEMLAILNGSGLKPLDSFGINDIALDEYFAQSAGLSSASGIANATNCGPMMLAQAYSIVIVTLEDASTASAVAADFEANMAWNKWICVSASSAMIAQKGNMVLCLMGNDDAYTSTASAITANGWTELRTLANPAM